MSKLKLHALFYRMISLNVLPLKTDLFIRRTCRIIPAENTSEIGSNRALAKSLMFMI